MMDARPPTDLQARVEVLEERVHQLEAQIAAAAKAYSRARFQARRIWLRPPLWTFEQHVPRPLLVKPSYARCRPPEQVEQDRQGRHAQVRAA